MTHQAADSPVSASSGLDPVRLRSLTADGLLAMDDGELFLELRHDEQLTFEDGRLKVAGRDWRGGFGFRGVAGERVGYACGDRLEEEAIRAAIATVQAVTGGHARPRERGVGGPPASLYAGDDPIASADRARKLAVLERIEAYCRAREPAVVSVTATLAASHQSIEILRGDGEHRTDLRPLVRLNVAWCSSGTGAAKAPVMVAAAGSGSTGCSTIAGGRRSPTMRCARPGCGSTRSRRRPAR